ncbi:MULTISPECIES: TRAP transporter small permease [Chromohalobacter]|jgi:TRAP-type C4-dicarboxylate transport system permease small subunit|uniref:TRAP transporter small permease protein n=1 Tax=Chromohalobacter moromii TaxID=2860329 RepID=A0A9X2X0E1_9GAMM|nr:MULTISPECIES: TRAP transporter small permease [Chromohalobacter]MCK2041311.1 TRAP transporter small permease [Chromohalobacter moromii]MCK2044253.1 TRAP transporter small permease [Chromohalobacter moromii]MCT8504587.1 TRAP transporter small permease [Chromohalobacter moromii]MCT8513459.1 TRAP transporter small permease [Chromohalobacter sp. TMW 2.2271]MDV6319778.1 TRAP transporter small permease [Chromohalobacter sp. HP20-39]
MHLVRRLLEGLCALLLAGIVLVPLAQVILRQVFTSPMVGAEEFTRFLLVCLVFMAYPLVVDNGENIVMAELRESLPTWLRGPVKVVILLCTIAASAFIAYATVITMQANLGNTTPTLKIPFWLFLGSTLLGFSAACLLHIVHGNKPPAADVGPNQ